MQHKECNQTLHVLIRPRLHVTLIGMNEGGYRCNGGVGFCVDEPRAIVSVTRASRVAIRDTRRWPLQDSARSRLEEMAKKVAPWPVRVEISGDMPSHHGFGSATAIRLATLEAIATIAGRRLGRQELVRLSGRGGTSGIGVTTYFGGGFVFDVGTRNPPGAPLLPSSAVEHQRPLPLVLSRLELPQWKIGLCIPGCVTPQTENQEIAFFRRTCPLANALVYETLYHVVYGVVASVKEGDFTGFCRAVRAIQDCTWKQLEWNLHLKSIRSVKAAIYDAGASVVGMSSLGPAMFFLANTPEAVIAALRDQYPEHVWHLTTCCNDGRVIRP